jgi:NAD dependent epimerase/dehydratase family enzyme
MNNKAFTKAIGQAKGGWHLYLPVPSFLLRLGLGEMADVVLNGNHVLSQKIENQGFVFQYKTIESALKDLLKRVDV